MVCAADAALDAIAAGSEEWAASVRHLKFEAHNREWLQLTNAEIAAAGVREADGAAAEAGALLDGSGFDGQAAGGGGIAAYWGPACGTPPAVAIA